MYENHIADITLAPEGEKKIRWVAGHMPVLAAIAELASLDSSLGEEAALVCGKLSCLSCIKRAFVRRQDGSTWRGEAK